MRYNIHQQALLKQAFDIVALALANSPVTDAVDSVDDIKTTATSSSPASEFFAQLPYEQAQHSASARVDRAIEPPQLTAAQAATAPKLPIHAQHFFSGLPWDFDTATQDTITTQQPTTPTQTTAGDWFSSIDWQHSTSPDADVQSFAHLATSTALHTASRSVSSTKP
jgi:hypothetical protein